MTTFKVVLAEKPSVARDIAKFLKANQKRPGYLEGNGYVVTWAYGHLVTLKEPADYSPELKRWSFSTLPFIPKQFALKPVDSKHTLDQFRIVTQLFQNAQEIICATDAGREGELIFRYILEMSGCQQKKVWRLWLSSLTDQAIAAGFRNLHPGEKFQNLYEAARCRSQSDWVVGINGTRFFTLKYGQGGQLWSVGRVQTPVLAIVTQREEEILYFEPKSFWELQTKYRETIFKYKGKRFEEKDKGEKFLAKVVGHPLTIIDRKSKRETENPPLLYDLTELQREMNRRYSLSAAKTLELAQTLYERKFISYPRTDSRYLSSDIKPQIPKILDQLKAIKGNEISVLNLQKLPFSKRIIQNTKVSDHHAIIPTGNIPSGLSAPMSYVYEAIVIRLIAIFYPPCLKDVTTITAEVNKVKFQCKGTVIVDPGWTKLYPKKKKNTQGSKKENEEKILPDFQVDESGPHEPFLKEGKTQPPKYFTENTLLATMENAGKTVDDEKMKEALKERGLGTPATRASIIETLLHRKYIYREKKNLKATPWGRYLVALVQDERLKSAEMTGQWEYKLKQIERGEFSPDGFMQEISQFTKEIFQPKNCPNDWGNAQNVTPLL